MTNRYHEIIRSQYPWITQLDEVRDDRTMNNVLCVTAGEDRYAIPVDITRPDAFPLVCKRLDGITYNRMVAADTKDWYDAPTGGQHD